MTQRIREPVSAAMASTSTDTERARQCAIETDTLVVGAGPHALTVLARWLCERPERVDGVLAVDPAGSWLRAWDRQFQQQQIDVLRSPGVHHPDPDEMAFLHAHQYLNQPTGCTTAQTSSTTPTHALTGDLRRPGTAAFAHFCQELVERTRLTDRVLAGTLVDLDPIGRTEAITADGHRRPDKATAARWIATLDDRSLVLARQVVWAGNARTPCLPPGVQRGDTVTHSNDVDPTTITHNQRIAVLGGGQSAGQLALIAAHSGAEVMLISRGPRRIVDLDVDAGWLMDDHLDPFRAIADPAERRRAVEQARRGSMTEDLAASLTEANVRWFCEAGELLARPDGDGAVVGFGGAEIPVDRVLVATGSTPDLRADPALAKLARCGAPHVDGWPILNDRLEWQEALVVIGALAALTLGPAAGNLGGARAAADLLAWHAPTA